MTQIPRLVLESITMLLVHDTHVILWFFIASYFNDNQFISHSPITLSA